LWCCELQMKKLNDEEISVLLGSRSTDSDSGLDVEHRTILPCSSPNLQPSLQVLCAGGRDLINYRLVVEKGFLARTLP
jgi:hypothetical protein